MVLLGVSEHKSTYTTVWQFPKTAYGFDTMALQRILEADLMTHLLFLGGLTTLVCIVLLEAKNQVKQLTGSGSSEEMIGLFYHLSNGVDLFICKASRGKARLIADLIKRIVKHPSEAKDVIDINAFQEVCGEVFISTKLHTKLIPSDANIYPMYHNIGILTRRPDNRI